MTTHSPDTLAQLPVRAVMKLFHELPAPSIEEMHGEFAARLLKQVSPAMGLTGQLVLDNPLLLGRWQCKAFRPDGADKGRGYNGFLKFGRRVNRFPMRTLIAPSRYDGKPAYTLVYRAFHSACGAIHMVDEVRRLNDGLYLGLGTAGFTDQQRRLPMPFVLSGPVAAYAGDVGHPKSGFDPTSEIPTHT